jgi:hypothetical protein
MPLLGALLILALAAIACRSMLGDGELRGSGIGLTQTRAVPAFTGVELSGLGVLTVRSGAARQVKVHGDDNLVRRVTARVRAGVLVVGLKGRVRPRRQLRIAVTTPTIEALALTGSGTVVASRVTARRLRVELSGTGSVSARGRVRSLDVELDGVGEVLLADLRTRAADVQLNGTGRIVLDVTRSLDATVAGAGEILYSGDPDVRGHVDGVGVITKVPSR